MKLSENKLEEVKSVLFNTARPLDIELFKYKFENGEKNLVIEELAKYQNDDGGFGHGIEPDIRLKSSSPIATTIGLQYCLKIGLSTEHEIYQEAIRFFKDNLNKKGVYWPNTYENVNDEPHAPWWQVEKITEPPIERWANANAEIAGYFFKTHDRVKEITKLLEKKILQILDQTELIEGLYNLMCWERGFQNYPSPIRDKTKEMIIRSYKNISPLTKEKMGEIRIFFLTSKPSDLVNEVLSEEVSEMLDIEIKLLDTHNCCIPTWEWGMYPETWEIAKKEWIGKMTVDFLTTLKNYDRLN